MTTPIHKKYPEQFKSIAYVHKLQKSGLSQKTAIIEAEALENITEEMRENALLIRADIANTNLKIAEIERSLTLEIEKNRMEIEKIRTDLSRDIEKVRTDLSRDIEKVRTDLSRDIQNARIDLTRDIEKIRADLSRDIQNVRVDLTRDIEKIRADLSHDIENARADLTRDIEKVRADLLLEIEKTRTQISVSINRVLVYMFGLALSLSATMLGIMAKGFNWI